MSRFSVSLFTGVGMIVATVCGIPIAAAQDSSETPTVF